MKNELSRAMASADVKVRYDTQCKRVLSQKEILARILARTVKEFAGMSVEEIIPCIEGTPEIAVVSIDPGKQIKKEYCIWKRKRELQDLPMKIKWRMREKFITISVFMYIFRMKKGIFA